MGRTFLLTVVTLAVGVLAYWPTVRSLVGYWEDTDNLSYTHGYLIAAIAVWLVWRSRGAIAAAGTRPWWPALPVTIVLSFVWYLAWISGLEIGHQVLFPLILIAAVAAAAGWRAALAASFGVGYLYFAIPIWSLINSQLQSLTTIGVSFLVRATGLPAYIEGNFVHIPSGAFEIAGGCSGVHFFIVALAIAALYGELDRERLRNRVLLLAIAAAMAIVMNWIRVYTIILNGHLTDMQGFLVKVDHYYFGWALFAVLLVIFFWGVRRFLPLAAERRLQPVPTASASVAASSAGAVAALVVLVAGPLAAAVVESNYVASDARPTLVLPPGQGGWGGPAAVATGWRPVYPKADAESMGEYADADVAVTVYVNRYDHQAQGHELAGSGNSILGDGGWKALGYRQAGVDSGGETLSYREVTAVAAGDERRVIGYFYAVGGRNLTAELPSKLYYGIAALGARTSSGVIAAAAPCGTDCNAASATVGRFLATHGTALASTLHEGTTQP